MTLLLSPLSSSIYETCPPSDTSGTLWPFKYKSTIASNKGVLLGGTNILDHIRLYMLGMLWHI